MITHTARRPTDYLDWHADDDRHFAAERRTAERERFEGLPGEVIPTEPVVLPDQTSTHDMQPVGDRPIDWELAQNPRRWVPVYYMACKRCRSSVRGAKLDKCPHYRTSDELVNGFLVAFDGWLDAGCPIDWETKK